jgi:fructose-1,6-bisphosphatase/inositol monophosphatase family enzyme
MNPWDCLAGVLMILEAGGLARPVTPDAAGGIVLATAPLVFAPLNAVVDKAPVDARPNP